MDLIRVIIARLSIARLWDREGEWRVLILGSRATADWEMKVQGPRGFERTYTLFGPDQHQPAVIRDLLLKLLR